MLRLFFFFPLFLVLCLTGCKEKSIGPYEIAFDPLWYPLDFMQKDNNVIGFSTEILTKIAKEENLELSIFSTNWDSLIPGLQSGKYEAMLSSLHPYGFNLQLYDFSDIYLPIGLVLVLPTNSPYQSLSEITDKEIAVLAGTSGILILEPYPNILAHSYNTISEIINDLLAGQISGALIPLLSAQTYTQGSFQSELKISSPPLGNEGLRLVTLKGKSPQLIKRFDRGLKKIQKNGEYSQLLSEWRLIQTPL